MTDESEARVADESEARVADESEARATDETEGNDDMTDGAGETEREEGWGPWGNTFSELQEAVGGLVDGALRSVSPNSGRFPRYDLVDIPGAGYRVLLDLPGLEKGDVEVTIANRELTVAGERSRPSLPEGAEVQRSERVYGRFRRSIRIPGDVDASGIAAKMEHGVLEVTLPLREAADAQTIRVD